MRTRKTTTFFSLLSLAALATLGVVPSACGGKDKPADDATSAFGTSSSTADMPSTDATSATTSTPTASASDAPTPLGGVFGTGPAASGAAGKDIKAFDALAASPALKLDTKGVAAAKDALAKKMTAVAKTAAPGMAPEGPLGRASLKEGERAQMDVSLQPGTCYTVIATSDKIKDLDLFLMVPPGEMSAQDTTDDESPVIGKTPAPFCPDAATSYKLGVFAEKGAGDAIVQLFSKKK